MEFDLSIFQSWESMKKRAECGNVCVSRPLPQFSFCIIVILYNNTNCTRSQSQNTTE